MELKFRINAEKVPGLLGIGKKDQSVEFLAETAQKAREAARKRFPKAKSLILYQLRDKSDNLEDCDSLAEYTRAWVWNWPQGKNEWLRVVPGDAKQISEVPDSTSDRKYEAYLRSIGMLK